MPINTDAYREIVSELQEQSIALVAVSKTKTVEDILALYREGQRDFGENYVQEFEGKAPHVGGIVGGTAGARFHLIGHLQSNKSKKAAELFQAIHTVDSAKLAQSVLSSPQTVTPMGSGMSTGANNTTVYR